VLEKDQTVRSRHETHRATENTQKLHREQGEFQPSQKIGKIKVYGARSRKCSTSEEKRFEPKLIESKGTD